MTRGKSFIKHGEALASGDINVLQGLGSGYRWVVERAILSSTGTPGVCTVSINDGENQGTGPMRVAVGNPAENHELGFTCGEGCPVQINQSDFPEGGTFRWALVVHLEVD